MRTKLTPYLKVAMIALLYFVSVNVSGQVQISDEAGLRAIANNLAGDYKLMADITLTADWDPIGTDENRFTGIINGNGKTIYGLKFRDSSRNGAGFIGVAEGATIENLNIVGAQIYGGQDVAGIVGRAYAPTYVEKCYTSGAFSGWDHVGGIIGGTQKSNPEGEFCVVSDCFSTAAVISTEHQAGGIVGAAKDINIGNTYFAGVAVCRVNRTGGIVALVDAGTTSIMNSVVMAPYLKGAADKTNRILGGVNDEAFSDLTNNYSWENTEVYQDGVLYTDGVSNKNDVDGEHVTAATLKSASFYTGLSWNSSIWKIADGNYPVFSNQSYPLNADGIYVPTFPARPLPGNTFDAAAISGLGRTVSYNSSDPTVASISAAGLVSFLKDGTTTLTFSTQGDDTYLGATLTMVIKVEGINYNITTEQDLRNIKYDLAGTFTLMNNITMTSDWELLGTFKGTLNGNGHIIYGLRYDDKEKYGVGLFGNAEGATVTKLGIEKAYIVGNGDVGAIMGNAYGCTISECYVADSYIAGRDHVAAIVGAMRSYDKVIDPGDPDNGIDPTKEKTFTTIKNCHSAANIYSREYQAGGIAGIICGGVIEKCYFSGMIKALDGRAAGIVSLVDNDDPGEVKNNINLAAAVYCPLTFRIGDWGGRGPADALYPVKFTNNWSADKSYFGIDLKNSQKKTNENAEDNSREGRTTTGSDNPRSQAFYSAKLGWDFDNTWKFIEGTDGKMYPVLKWQQAPVFSEIYGMPDPAYLTWTAAADDFINLDKISASYGQDLKFEVIEGSQYVDDFQPAQPFLYIKEIKPTEEGWAKVKISIKDPALNNNVFNIQIPDFNIQILFENSVFDVSTAADFLAINDKPFAKYRLTADIDLTGVTFKGIGSSDVPFSGQLDGNGHRIINPVVTTADGNKKGLFNATKGAKIQKLGVVNFSFSGSKKDGSGSTDLGGLVGSCKNTTIDQCYLTGHIVGRDHVGGLIGGDCENVTIKNSYVNATVDGGQQVAGFFGVTAGDGIVIENSYFNGAVSATSRGWAGGMIGLIDRAGSISFTGAVSIGDVSSVEVAGHHVGANGVNGTTATISKFYHSLHNYDALIKTNGSEWTIQSETPGQVTYSVGKSPVQLKQKATYTAIGWDFDNIWTIEEGTSYPKLRNVFTNIPFVKSDNTNNYTYHTADNIIIIAGIEQSADVAVFNVNGQQVYHSFVNDNAEIPVSGKGFYIVRITENGKTTSLKVVVK